MGPDAITDGLDAGEKAPRHRGCRVMDGTLPTTPPPGARPSRRLGSSDAFTPNRTTSEASSLSFLLGTVKSLTAFSRARYRSLTSRASGCPTIKGQGTGDELGPPCPSPSLTDLRRPSCVCRVGQCGPSQDPSGGAAAPPRVGARALWLALMPSGFLTRVVTNPISD